MTCSRDIGRQKTRSNPMRQAPGPIETTAPAAVRYIHAVTHLSPPRLAPATCNPRSCQWQTTSPSSSASGDLQTMLIILLCVLICCALSLSFAVRCFLRRCSGHDRQSTTHLPQTLHELELKPAATASLAVMAKVFTPEVELSGSEAECTICLTEFVGGEEIMVLEGCRHGFHMQCIEKWLRARSSCPTCRTSCVAVDYSEMEGENGPTQGSENGGSRAEVSPESNNGATLC